MQLDDELFFILRDVASLNIRPQVIQPSQSATLPTSLQTCKLLLLFFFILFVKKKTFFFNNNIDLTSSLRNLFPFAFSIDFNVVAENFIFQSRPCPSVESLFHTVGFPSHFCRAHNHFSPFDLTISNPIFFEEKF